jgi:hypothetical protein
MNTNPSKFNGSSKCNKALGESASSASSLHAHGSPAHGKVTGKRDEITKLRCATDSTPWEHPVEEFAAWLDEEIVRLEDRFAQYSTISGRRKSFSR